MSDVNFNRYNFCLSLKVVHKYHFIPLDKGLMTESLVFFCRHTVLNVLALAIWGYIHYTTISVTFSCHSICIFQIIIIC